MKGLHTARRYSNIAFRSSGDRRARRSRDKARMDNSEAICHFSQSIGASVELNCSKDSLHCGCHGLVGHTGSSQVEQDAVIQAKPETRGSKLRVLRHIPYCRPFS